MPVLSSLCDKVTVVWSFVTHSVGFLMPTLILRWPNGPAVGRSSSCGFGNPALNRESSFAKWGARTLIDLAFPWARRMAILSRQRKSGSPLRLAGVSVNCSRCRSRANLASSSAKMGLINRWVGMTPSSPTFPAKARLRENEMNSTMLGGEAHFASPSHWPAQRF